MPHPVERFHAWPYFRQDPDCVVLDVRPGHKPNGLPAVRIFLGTEEAQYRAERIFFYSIEQVRDPARVYEIHLMNNIRGFDRRKWRTGFTNYRYAIPEFAGFQGKAIYNDVDQIYLADPAWLFDLDMAGHGYLAISAQDTSVMLIDCARMKKLWNRQTASTSGKSQLITKNSRIPGLWGKLDPHWNARDQEYIEGQTKCLHFTALHQQPWIPFPDDYSYHPNPLAYIWHDLERKADRDGYEVFRADSPSPNLAAVLARNDASAATEPVRMGAAVARLLEENQAKTVLAVSALGQQVAFDSVLGDRAVTSLSLAPAMTWPEDRFDAVLAGGVLEHVPPADLPWLLGRLFASADRLVCLMVAASEPVGLGSADWWRRRIDEIAKRHPGIDWRLDIVDKSAAIPETSAAYEVHRTSDPGKPRMWLLLDGDPTGDAQVTHLAAGLGWPAETKNLAYRMHLGAWSLSRSASVASLDQPSAADLVGPWPDLVIAAGEHSAPIAAWVRQQSSGATRIVQLGCPQAPFGLFDLIVTLPQQRLPIRDNVLHATAPIACLAAAADKSDLAAWNNALAVFEKPWTTLFVGPPVKPSTFNKTVAKRLGELVTRRMRNRGGQLFLWLDDGLADDVRESLLDSLMVRHQIANDIEVGDATGNDAALLANTAHCIVTGDDIAHLSAACLSGKPVEIYELPKWYDGLPMAKPVANALGVLTGGGTTYRGTPHQQHILGRSIDALITRGLLSPSPDIGALHRGLIGRGLATLLSDGKTVSSRKPLDDLDIVVDRVRQLMCETPVAV